jgi:DNA-binding transcriptional ArsR family regulator
MSSDNTDAGTRDLRDPKALRAMAHPVRLQVLEILGAEGPLTATELGERIDESPANTSFHLRTLAKYGFVEEAERGKGRNRPWREVKRGLLVREEELHGEARRAAIAMSGARRGMLFRRIERWAEERFSYSKRWQSVCFESEFNTRMTADELRRVSRQIWDILEPFKRAAEDVPKGAKAVTIAAWGVRTDPPDASELRRS